MGRLSKNHKPTVRQSLKGFPGNGQNSTEKTLSKLLTVNFPVKVNFLSIFKSMTFFPDVIDFSHFQIFKKQFKYSTQERIIEVSRR